VNDAHGWAAALKQRGFEVRMLVDRRDWFKAIRKALPSQQYPQSPNLYGSSSMKGWGVLG
jgi:hypothetical protein